MRVALWTAGFAALALLLHLLSGILLPFVVGVAIAYFVDPVADRLETWGCSRTLATCLIIAAFFVVVGGGLVLLFPLIQAQIVGLVSQIPDFIEGLRAYVEPYVNRLRADLKPEDLQRLQDAAETYAGTIIEWITALLAGLWSGGVAFLHLLSLLIITPVVAFYLVRDWDRIVAHVDSLLPVTAAPTIREQVGKIDSTISAFVRGQATVCLILAAYYAVALTLIGLPFGLLVGIGAGLISFIPYIGASVGLIVGLAIAYAHFDQWASIIGVAAVFLAGQTAESYVLTPKLVGDRVGLHPVWIMFALLAGGALFGFTGVLLAVPAAAVIGVLVRFAIVRYRDSDLYQGGGP